MKCWNSLYFAGHAKFKIILNILFPNHHYLIKHGSLMFNSNNYQLWKYLIIILWDYLDNYEVGNKRSVKYYLLGDFLYKASERKNKNL